MERAVGDARERGHEADVERELQQRDRRRERLPPAEGERQESDGGLSFVRDDRRGERAPPAHV